MLCCVVRPYKYFVLSSAVLRVLRCAVLCCVVLCCQLCCVVLHCTELNCVVLCRCVVVCCVVVCCGVVCCVALRCRGFVVLCCSAAVRGIHGIQAFLLGSS